MCTIGLVGYDPLKITAILAISPQHIVFENFLEILLNNDVTSSRAHVR